MSRSLPLSGQPPISRPDSALIAPLAPLAAKGFRPFFLLAAAFASLVVPLWLSILSGKLVPPGYFEPLSWHAHEMLFGFAVAVIAGFLLTAVSNWTGRETLTGTLLLALCALWLAGRLGVLFGAFLPRGAAAVIDLLFIPALALGVGRPLIATRNRRNFVMLGLLLALFVGNAVMHSEPLGLLPRGAAQRASLVAVDLLVVLLALMAGRIFPMFTRNATRVDSVRSLPALDAAAVASLLALAVADAVGLGAAVPWIAVVAAVLAIARAVTWGTRFVFRQPLLWILHVGYAWIPVGLLLRAAGNTLGTHALTLGALGSITLGMMARVSLGHTGRQLAPSRPITVAFAAITCAALARVVVPLLWPAYYLEWLWVAGALWTLSFSLFVWVYAPILARPRPDGKPG